MKHLLSLEFRSKDFFYKNNATITIGATQYKYMQNEFKFSTLRQFGSENISFTATVHSDKMTLSDKEIQDQINMIDTAITKEFEAIQKREVVEKELLTLASEKRTATVKALDEALKEEMKAGKDAANTMNVAEKLSKKLTKNN